MKVKDQELGLPDEVFEHIAEIRNDNLVDNIEFDLPEGTKQILDVKGHSIFAANWVDLASSGKTFSASTILLTGKNSPSSHAELSRAYITIEEDGEKLRRPHYSRANGAIYLWIHHRNLEAILTQIHEPKINCWIGHFPGGHIYGDIHTSHP